MRVRVASLTISGHRRLNEDGHSSVLGADAVSAASVLRHGAVADHVTTADGDRRTSTAAERAVHDAHERLTEMRVDGAVEEEVQREIDRLERVGDGDGHVVRVDEADVADGGLVHEVHQLGRYHQREVHGDNDDQRQRDSVSGAAVASASRTPTDATSGRLSAHAQRAAQLDDQVDVAEDEKNERRRDADDEVRPLVGAVEGRMICRPEDVDEVQVAALETRNGVDPIAQKARDVGQDADGEYAAERHGGERAADDLASAQRVAYGDVATDGHRDGQPSAGHDERVDQRVAVRLVDNPPVVLTIAERTDANVCSWQHRDTEQGVRYSQTCSQRVNCIRTPASAGSVISSYSSKRKRERERERERDFTLIIRNCQQTVAAGRGEGAAAPGGTLQWAAFEG